jgi:hypothetical protein
LGPIPNLEDEVPVLMSLSDRLAQLYPQAPGSFLAAFYDLQDCDGDVLTYLHTVKIIYVINSFIHK